MSHFTNTRAFSRRMGRGFWNRAKRFSESAKPATGRLASDGATGADSGLISGTPGKQPDCLPAKQPGVQSQAGVTRILGTPSPTHSAGGGVLSVLVLHLEKVDRWAILALIAVAACAWAVQVIRANRSSRPHTPTRGNSSARPRLSVDE